MPENTIRKPIVTYFSSETIDGRENYPKIKLCAEILMPVWAEFNSVDVDSIKQSIVDALERNVSFIRRDEKGAEDK